MLRAAKILVAFSLLLLTLGIQFQVSAAQVSSRFERDTYGTRQYFNKCVVGHGKTKTFTADILMDDDGKLKKMSRQLVVPRPPFEARSENIEITSPVRDTSSPKVSTNILQSVLNL